jgi:uncharacterized protein YjbJ (UPF0337 family)
LSEYFGILKRIFAMGEFVDKVKGAANEAFGKAKVSVAKSTDDPKMMAKGLAQEAKGKAQNAMGAAKGKLGDKL